MRKIIAILATVGVFLSLCACGASNPQTLAPSEAPSAAQEVKTETPSAPAPPTPAKTPAPTPVPTIAPMPTPEPVRPVVVFEDERVKISFIGLERRGVVFEVENYTDINITIQADSISINKKSINDITMSADIAPNSIGQAVARCEVDPSIGVETIGGQLTVIDFDRSFKSYNAKFMDIAVNEGVTVESSTLKGTLVYEDKRVRIGFAGLDERGVVFEVENLTDANITIQADSISINKKSINDIIMSADIAPNSIGQAVARCEVDPSIGVETIGGQLTVIDFDKSFKSYNAKFINIEIP